MNQKENLTPTSKNVSLTTVASFQPADHDLQRFICNTLGSLHARLVVANGTVQAQAMERKLLSVGDQVVVFASRVTEALAFFEGEGDMSLATIEGQNISTQNASAWKSIFSALFTGHKGPNIPFIYDATRTLASHLVFGAADNPKITPVLFRGKPVSAFFFKQESQTMIGIFADDGRGNTEVWKSTADNVMKEATGKSVGDWIQIGTITGKAGHPSLPMGRHGHRMVITENRNTYAIMFGKNGQEIRKVASIGPVQQVCRGGTDQLFIMAKSGDQITLTVMATPVAIGEMLGDGNVTAVSKSQIPAVSHGKDANKNHPQGEAR